MDNHAGNRDFVLGYVCGMVDGEGTIGIHRGSIKYDQHFKAVIKIYNTNPDIVQAVHQYLEILEIPHHIRKAIPRIGTKVYKPLYSLTIEGFKRVKTALEILVQGLAGKKLQAELLLEICNLRLNTPMTGGNQNRLWTSQQLELVAKIKELNQRKSVDSSQT